MHDRDVDGAPKEEDCGVLMRLILFLCQFVLSCLSFLLCQTSESYYGVDGSVEPHHLQPAAAA